MDVHMNGNDNGSRKTPVQDDDDMMYQTPHGQSSYCASSTGCSDGGETPNEYHLYAGSSASRFAAGKKRHAQTTDPSNLDNTNNNDGRFTKKRSPSDTDEIAWNSGSVYGDNDHYGDLVYGEAHAQMDACISQVESVSRSCSSVFLRECRTSWGVQRSIDCFGAVMNGFLPEWTKSHPYGSLSFFLHGYTARCNQGRRQGFELLGP